MIGETSQNVPQNTGIRVKTYPDLPFFCFFVDRSEEDPTQIRWLACNITIFGIALPTNAALCFRTEEEADKYAERLLSAVQTQARLMTPLPAKKPQIAVVRQQLPKGGHIS